MEILRSKEKKGNIFIVFNFLVALVANVVLFLFPEFSSVNKEEVGREATVEVVSEVIKKDYYKDLSQITYKSVSMTVKDHKSGGMLVLNFTGEKLYKNFLSQKKSLSSVDKDRVFRNYIGKFYKRILGEEGLGEFQENTGHDIFDYRNYKKDTLKGSIVNMKEQR